MPIRIHNTEFMTILSVLNESAYLSRLCEKHDVKVAHFVPGRGANVGVVVHVGAVVRAPAIQKSTLYIMFKK
jgi:hypothetical protein